MRSVWINRVQPPDGCFYDYLQKKYFSTMELPSHSAYSRLESTEYNILYEDDAGYFVSPVGDSISENSLVIFKTAVMWVKSAETLLRHYARDKAYRDWLEEAQDVQRDIEHNREFRDRADKELQEKYAKIKAREPEPPVEEPMVKPEEPPELPKTLVSRISNAIFGDK